MWIHQASGAPDHGRADAGLRNCIRIRRNSHNTQASRCFKQSTETPQAQGSASSDFLRCRDRPSLPQSFATGKHHRPSSAACTRPRGRRRCLGTSSALEGKGSTQALHAGSVTLASGRLHAKVRKLRVFRQHQPAVDARLAILVQPVLNSEGPASPAQAQKASKTTTLFRHLVGQEEIFALPVLQLQSNKYVPQQKCSPLSDPACLCTAGTATVFTSYCPACPGNPRASLQCQEAQDPLD